jgi:hypothetical protein
MRLRVLLFSVVCACFVFGTAPESSHARDEQTAKAKAKKKKKKKKKSKRKSAKKSESKTKTKEASEEVQSEDGKPDPNPYAEGSGEEPVDEEEAPMGILSEGTTGDGALRRSNRMEFDERLVKGQAAKSGAVYLFKRVPRRLPGLVPMRKSYRRRIVEPVLGQWTLKPATYSKKKDAPSEGGDRKGSYVATSSDDALDTGAGSTDDTLLSPKKENEKPGGDK